ncbi:MAG TPA: T9SS type A sorting domain-containing protein [Bacteroides sp.]|nr:T9SS type A sorting domain-containing protein [Bacteroides sp.]
MRKNLPHILMLAIFLPALTLVYGQVSQGGQPYSLYANLKSAHELPLIDITPPKNTDLPEENAQDRALYRVAIGNEVDIELSRDGHWESIPGEGRVCRLNIRSAGAKAIHIFFEEYALPEGGELFIYNKDQSRILGAYTASNNRPSGKLAIQAIPGEEICIEYFEPEGADFPAVLRIGNIGHNYRENILYDVSGFGDSQKCNKDINCTQAADWQTEKRAVCKILYKKNNDNYYLCTGALINNARNDGSPYFLTANHCVSSNTEAESIVLYFNYESPTCNGPEGSDKQTVSGSSILATTYRLDFSLVELSEKPPLSYEPWYAGWDARDQPPDKVVTIHHPAGDVKKISSFTKSPVTGDFTYLYDYDDSTHWYINDWTLGITEGGSSGSPLFNSKGQIVGDLTGGSSVSNCTSSDAYYAKFSDSWADYTNLTTHLKPWLDPDSTGVMAIEGYDPLVPSGVEDFEAKDFNAGLQFEVYPNPAGDYLNIKSKNRTVSGYTVELLDLSGKLIRRKQVDNQRAEVRMQVSSFQNGFYLLRITYGDSVTIKKLIIL